VLSAEARSDFAKGGVDVEGAAASLHRRLSLQDRFACSVHMFFAAAEAQTYCRHVVKMRLFSSCFEYQGMLVGSRIVYPS
jgi:hypothetical protein